MQHERRQIVQQLRVIDVHQHRGSVRRGSKRPLDASDTMQRTRIELTSPMRERPERNRLSRTGRHFASQSCFADTGATCDRHTGVQAVIAEHVRDEIRFLSAARQRPCLHGDNAKRYGPKGVAQAAV